MPEDKPDSTKGDPKPNPDDLGDAGKRALDEERKARRDAERVVDQLTAKLKAFDDRDKSETEKLADRVVAAEKRADDADSRVLRAEVAFLKGLTPAQAKRLAGTSREELEGDADELLRDFAVAEPATTPAGDRPSPATRPAENLRGGSDPTSAPPSDLRKVISDIPR